MTKWSRHDLWARDDARRGQRRLLATFCLPSLFVLLAGVRTSCLESARETAPAECASDADCALVPASFTCCGECPPAVPFEAVSAELLKDVREEWAEQCAPPTRLCEPPACSPVPDACVARAICDRGACRVAATAACTYR